MRIVKIVALTLLVACMSCKEEANPRFPDIEVAINDTNEVAISDSIYYIITDTLPNKVTAISKVSDANMFFSVNSAAFIKRNNEPLTLQKQDSVFQFYLTKRGYEDSELKTVILQEQAEEFLAKVNVSSPILDSNLTLSMNDKSRGMLQVEIFSLTGQRLLQRKHLKNVDSFIISYALADYSKGIYVVLAAYGKNQKAYRLIKE